MSAREGFLERLLDWAAGASREDRLRRARARDEVELPAPAYSQLTDDWAQHARRDREREIEVRVLMSTWM